MNRDPDPMFDPRIADWLETDPTDAPAQVLTTVLAAVPSISQRRASRVPWRFPTMFSSARLATASIAGAVALVAGLTLFWRASSNVAVPGSPAPSNSTGPASPTPSLASINLGKILFSTISFEPAATGGPTPSDWPTFTLVPGCMDNIISGRRDIFVTNADGSGQTRLTNDPSRDHGMSLLTAEMPTWSGDGTTIAFAGFSDCDRSAGSPNFGGVKIHLMRADGSYVTKIEATSGVQGRPAISPDGRTIAFARSTNAPSIQVIGVDGRGEASLTSGHSDGEPAWSPDGARIAFTRDANRSLEIWVMNADGSGAIRLAVGASPAWSPDGSRIAFTRSIDGGWGEIWVMNADGSDQTNLTNDPADDGWATWSPDGLRIAFNRAV
ncbi:MAG: hypothetical protein ABIR64_03035, partial [Candidatus Limnocylindrales bacterium]